MKRVPKSNGRLAVTPIIRTAMSRQTQPHAIPMTLQVVQTARSEEFRNVEDRVASRELGLYSATGGMLSARRIVAAGDWDPADFGDEAAAWLTFLYVLHGSITLRLPGTAITLCPHDAVLQAPLATTPVIAASSRVELLEIQALDDARIRGLIPARPLQVVSLDAPQLHVRGQGPRDFFDYRDLGLADTTGGWMEVQVIRAQRARRGGTGWHCHSMAQLSYGLSGWASLGVEGLAQELIQEPGDALSIPAGCVHNADSFSDDYWALQLQLPAHYETTPRPPPRGM